MKRKLIKLILTFFVLSAAVPAYADTYDDGEVIEVAELTQEEMDYVASLESVNHSESETSVGNSAVYSYVNLGSFKLTAYCPCDICNYPYGGYPTALGTDYIEGRTIAVDPRVIPLGSIVEINIPGEGWHQYRAEDTGGKIKGNRIDILVNGHDNCYQARYNTYCEVRLLN